MILRFLIRKCFVFIAVALLLSCQEKVARSDQVMSEDQMIILLTDIHLVDGILSTKSLPSDLQKIDTLIFAEVYASHGVTKSILDSSISFYMNHNPRAFKRIYNQVLIRLSKLEGDIEVL